MTTPGQGLAVSTGAAGTPVDAIAANQAGGYIVNPLDPEDQGQAAGSDAVALYVNQVGPAATIANTTTLALQPGQSYSVVPQATTPVSVASKLAGHRFTAVMWS